MSEHPTTSAELRERFAGTKRWVDDARVARDAIDALADCEAAWNTLRQEMDACEAERDACEAERDACEAERDRYRAALKQIAAFPYYASDIARVALRGEA